LQAEIEELDIGRDGDVLVPIKLQHDPMERGDHQSGGGIGVDLAWQLVAALCRDQQRAQHRARLVEAAADNRADAGAALRFRPQLNADAPPAAFTRVGELAEEGVANALQDVDNVRLLLRIGDQLLLHRMPVIGDGFDDLFLAGKVGVDGARAEPGLRHDVLHRRAVETLAREAREGGVENLAATRIAV